MNFDLGHALEPVPLLIAAAVGAAVVVIWRGLSLENAGAGALAGAMAQVSVRIAGVS